MVLEGLGVKRRGRPTVLDPIFHHQLSSLFARLPPRRNDAPWRFPTKVSQLLVCLVHDSMLLLQIHLCWILVRISMQATVRHSQPSFKAHPMGLYAHFVTRITNHLTFFPEGVERVPWDEPRRLDLVLVEELEETTDAYGAGKDAYSPSQLSISLKLMAGIPRDMSLVESSPPYEPSHPATASMSTEMHVRTPEQLVTIRLWGGPSGGSRFLAILFDARSIHPPGQSDAMG